MRKSFSSIDHERRRFLLSATVGAGAALGVRGTSRAREAAASPLFDYIRRVMPVSAPGSLSNEQVHSLVAFILGEAGITSKELVLDAESLARVEMPNRDGFVPDDRLDVP